MAHTAIDFPAAMIEAGLLYLRVWTIETGYGAVALVLLAVFLLRLPPRLSRKAA